MKCVLRKYRAAGSKINTHKAENVHVQIRFVV